MSGNRARVYYQCVFNQQSPLRISTGSGEETDSDVMTDIRGLPLIPGTSITGVLRRQCLSLGTDDRLMRSLFGYVDQSGGARESKVIVSDAAIPANAVENQDFQIIPRNGVCLNDNDRGTAKKGGLFDFETVECRLPYTAVIELPDTAGEKEIEALEAALAVWAAEGVSFGARTTRGYGKVAASVFKRSFSFPEDLDEWLAFDPFAAGSFDAEGVEKIEARGPERSGRQAQIRIDVSFRMKGTFSVRKYTTDPPKGDQRSAPDYSPLSNMEKLPVIPGTSWAGSFRHHMRLLARQTEKAPEALEKKLGLIDALFGKTEDGKQRSKIRFSETAVRGSARYPVTRIAVDRFTNAPRSAGLFTSDVAWGGEGNLVITLPSSTDEWLLRLLSAALNDLNLGLMTVGGEANVGRGLCELASVHVNGSDRLDAVRACDTGYLIAGGVCVMDSWIQKQGDCSEDALGALLEEYMTDGYLAAAFFTDRFQGCRGCHLHSLLDSVRELLELRVFNDSGELWVHRSSCGRPFSWRLAGEAGCKAGRDFFSTVQALDIDETYPEYQRGEMDEYGSIKLRSTVKGHYALPLNKGDGCVKIINYVRYDKNGVAEAADYRLVGFAPLRVAEDWDLDEGGIEDACGD